MRMGTPLFTVVGAGGGGQAMAAYLALHGCRVNLFNRTAGHIEAVRVAGGIQVNGKIHGFGALNLVTDDMGAAVAGTDVILVAVPASAHGSVARRMARLLQPGQIVLLNPGRTGGALEFRHVLRRMGADAGVIVAEAQTFLFASRVEGPAEVRIYGVKRRVPVAALPAEETPKIVAFLNEFFPQFVAAESVWETSLGNIGAIFHPATLLLNAARLESGDNEFEYYHGGVTPTVAGIMERMDEERLSLARALAAPAVSARRWLEVAYGAEGQTLFEAIRNNAGYAGIRTPMDIHHRYIFEDVPTSLVPMASLGEIFGVPTPTIRSIIHLASVAHGVNYWLEGRRAERMGLRGLDPDAVRALAYETEREELIG